MGNWTLGIFGGVVGSVLTLAVQKAWAWALRPRLEIRFELAVPGCLVNGKARAGFKEKDPAGHCRERIEEGETRYLRVRVANMGRSTARNVNVVVSQLRDVTVGRPTIEENNEVLDLPFSVTNDSKRDLEREAYRFADVCSVTDLPSSPNAFELRVRPKPFHLERFEKGAATMEARVHAFADNAKGVTHSIKWSWTGGGPESLSIEPI